ncbi:DUF6055 domain-containing protein [Nocardioides sp. TRM66260-LWL]|uniref:MXAN_6640 family putative metalloprotease n=1 Tax=Nocardioides sp. TRM66260-LWL TaxID=2874478 RepID=UPI001CC42036|nr:MXAN_6640 family putative metalloprotease [Nocardioides sp. TRM66260-LWL]MBZ5735923.1 DUF6055 domain-containing protein [Nocardioides sp. TRM66260-LWL]
MRLTPRLAALLTSATCVVALVAPAGAAPGPTVGGTDPARAVATEALARVRAVLTTPAAGAGSARRAVPAAVRDRTDRLSLALRDLALTRSALTGPERREADRYLARPTDGFLDPQGDGYSSPETRLCGRWFCLHYVTVGADAPPSRAWVGRTLATMNAVRRAEVQRLGYRPPASDRASASNGGDGRFDVYLKDVGGQGIYGYCAPQDRVGTGNSYSGYCVLDDDFSADQFSAAPIDSLTVTAAHEFFHAIQFDYDAGEDPWLLESTATWMEEQVADGVDDNRQYLPQSSLARPTVPLDRFDTGRGVTQYGNWTWWQYLSERYGTDIVREVWRAASQYPGEGGLGSLAAVRSVLARRGGLPARLAAYASANTEPARFYSEGRFWPAAARSGTATLHADAPLRVRTGIDHLAARDYRLVPERDLRAGTRLRVAVRAPATTSPAAMLLVHRRDGRIVTLPVRLRSGRGAIAVPFTPGAVRWATLTLVNASTRYRCGTGASTDVCGGTPVDDDQPFAFSASAR